MRRTWNTWVSPTIGMVTIGTGKIGFGPACAAAGATSAIDAALAAAAIASSSRRVADLSFMFCAPFLCSLGASCAPSRLIINIQYASNAGPARRSIDENRPSATEPSHPGSPFALAWNLHKFWATWMPHEPRQPRYPHAPVVDLRGRDRQHYRDRAAAGPHPAGDHPAIAAAGGAHRETVVRACRAPADAERGRHHGSHLRQVHPAVA